MDKYLRMFQPAMTRWLTGGDGECNYWILGDQAPDALADVGSK